MKTLLNLTVALGLALSANMARADVDYDDLADECFEAYSHGVELFQLAQSLPSDFPNRSQFVDRAEDFVGLNGTAQVLQRIDDGELPEFNQSTLDSFEQTLRDIRATHTQWIKNAARQIERNSNGQTEDLAESMRRLADKIDDNLEEMIDEID